MINDLRNLLALSALLSVLVAALFGFGTPVQAQETSAQQQADITAQAAPTQGVPTLYSNDQKDTPVDLSDVISADAPPG